MINSTSALKAHLLAVFKAMGVNAYYFYADEGAEQPYVVFDLRHIGSLSDAEESKRYVMEVNAYTKGSVDSLDILLDRIEARLSDYRANTADYMLCVELDYGRIDIEEQRPLKRKRVMFEVKYFLGGDIN